MLTIHTLGEFDIRIDGKSIMSSTGHSYKILKLFKYFLTHVNQKLLPDRITEDFLMNEEFDEPRNVLRTQVSRVRNIIDWEAEGIERFFSISSVGGYYIMKILRDHTIDFEEFDRLISKGEASIREDKDKAIELLGEGLSHYNGEYLPELEDEIWLISLRSRYDWQYLKAITTYLDLLMEKKDYGSIIEMAEKAIRIKPHDENINILYMEALLGIGDRRYASTHYQYFTTKIYKDLGQKPSEQLMEVYKRIKNIDKEPAPMISVNNLEKNLIDNLPDRGITFCSRDHFKFLHNLELKNKERFEKDIYLGLVTLDSLGPISLDEEDMKQGMDSLVEVINLSLRKGDVASKWNEGQLALMLYSLKEEDLNNITQRITKNFHEKMADQNTTINIKYNQL